MDSPVVEQAPQQGRQDRLNGVVPVAAIQFVVSALIWLPSGLLLISDAITYHQYPHSTTVASLLTRKSYEWIVGPPLCLSLIGVFTGIGLLRLRNWARRVTLFMATVPACACVFFLHVHHPQGVGDSLFVIGDLWPAITWTLLIVLVPVSIWWWVFFMRADVRSRFR